MTIVRRPRSSLTAVVGTAAMVVGLVACDPGRSMISANPGLYPTFQSSVIDYVNRCRPNDPTDVTVRAPRGTTVSVAGQAPRGGTYTARVNQQVNERFTVVVTSGGTNKTHHVRCLPRDFPEWSADRSGTPQAQYYATVLITGFAPNIPVIFDTNGVPVWWAERQRTFLLTPLPNGNLATLFYEGGMVERRLDGTSARFLNTQGAASDFHDVLLLPNGNYVLVTADPRPCDLSLWGESRASCIFHDVQELTPTGQVVWNWRPEDDIPISETSAKWRTERDPLLNMVDPWHYNSVEWTGDGFVVSFRHLDAVYKIDYATKDVVWKLGGSRRPESLRVINDPVFNAGGSISGQHDARLMADGTLTLFDNGSKTPRAPRSVAYRVDEAARTATLRKQVTDSVSSFAPCCGSTRAIPTRPGSLRHRGQAPSNYVTGWGGGPWITENKPDGTQVFRLNASFVYRGTPIPYGQYTPAELRAGMDAQYNGRVLSPRAARDSRPPASETPAQLGDLAFRLGR